jgi:threonylcarbamoyladenosine tRNA methylthiotransferase MtaB
LTGIHSASYRSAEGGLAVLLRRLLGIHGLRRIRVNSLEPQWVDRDLIETLSSDGRFARHLHLPLQSGDAGVLKRMGRGYAPEDYRHVVETARERIPGVAIGADVMVGFPGEDEGAFERSAALLESIQPAYLHVFPYSERPGTAACRLPGSVGPRTARARAARLAALDLRFRTSFLQASEGTEHEILIEARRDRLGNRLGLTDTFIQVAIATDRPPGSWVRVRLRGIGDPRRMMGDVIA